MSDVQQAQDTTRSGSHAERDQSGIQQRRNKKPERGILSEQVKLHANPWLSGSQHQTYAGPIAAGLFLPDSPKADRFGDYIWAESAVIGMVQDQARGLNAHEIVGYVLTLDPFAERSGKRGLAVSLTGTAVRRFSREPELI